MYKMVIADDEYLVCQYVRHIINKYHLPFQICGEAGNGEAAIGLVDTHEPEFVMLDINMPGIDGLETARRIREKYPHIIIYILTAYRQFDYVREAMHAAVNDYLVKPIKPEDLVHTLKKGVEQALRYRIKKMQQQRVMKKLEEQEPLVLQQRIYELLNKKDKEAHLLRLFRYLSHRHTFFPVAVVCLAYWKSVGMSVPPFNRNFGQVYASKFEKYAVGVQTEQELILIFDSWNSAIRDKLRRYIKICETTHGITFCSSIAMVEKMPVTAVYRKANDICRRRLFWLQAETNFYRDEAEKKEDINMPAINRAFDDCIIERDRKHAEKILGQLFEAMEAAFYSVELVKATITRLGCGLLNRYSSYVEPAAARDLEKAFVSSVSKACNKYEARACLGHIMFELIGDISLNKNNAEKIAQWAVAYIENNYDKELTLEIIANEMFVSTGYLCRVFKKYVGKKYVSYLNDVRMKKARELLYSNQYTVAEVARMVGFKDASYFSSVFKRYYNCPPSSFLEAKATGNGSL